MNTAELITLVIHSPQRASKLKDILAYHKIEAVLKTVSLTGIQMTPLPVSVNINPSDLPVAIKVLESGQVSGTPLAVTKFGNEGNAILIPVDCSDASVAAVKMGFFLAAKFNSTPVLLHAYEAPSLVPSTPFPGAFDEGGIDLAMETEIADNDIYRIVDASFSNFLQKIKQLQQEGELPGIKFKTELTEGMPEKVISDFCKTKKPLLVVMATRGASQKKSDLVGSVTAEVIDACVAPVFTVPAQFSAAEVNNLQSILMFCTLTPFDMVTMRSLMRAFDFPASKVVLALAADLRTGMNESKLDNLAKYFGELYPMSTFKVTNVNPKNFDKEVKDVMENNNTSLIIVPNKKESALARLFRPAIAHKILFEKDVPILALPIL